MYIYKYIFWNILNETRRSICTASVCHLHAKCRHFLSLTHFLLLDLQVGVTVLPCSTVSAHLFPTAGWVLQDKTSEMKLLYEHRRFQGDYPVEGKAEARWGKGSHQTCQKVLPAEYGLSSRICLFVLLCFFVLLEHSCFKRCTTKGISSIYTYIFFLLDLLVHPQMNG